MKKITSINPANSNIVGEVLASRPDEIIEKIKCARAAAPAWKALGVKERIKILRPLEYLFDNKKNEIAMLKKVIY